MHKHESKCNKHTSNMSRNNSNVSSHRKKWLNKNKTFANLKEFGFGNYLSPKIVYIKYILVNLLVAYMKAERQKKVERWEKKYIK